MSKPFAWWSPIIGSLSAAVFILGLVWCVISLLKSILLLFR